jgi:hypothetical protein
MFFTGATTWKTGNNTAAFAVDRIKMDGSIVRLNLRQVVDGVVELFDLVNPLVPGNYTLQVSA